MGRDVFVLVAAAASRIGVVRVHHERGAAARLVSDDDLRMDVLPARAPQYVTHRDAGGRDHGVLGGAPADDAVGREIALVLAAPIKKQVFKGLALPAARTRSRRAVAARTGSRSALTGVVLGAAGIHRSNRHVTRARRAPRLRTRAIPTRVVAAHDLGPCARVVVDVARTVAVAVPVGHDGRAGARRPTARRVVAGRRVR